MKNTHYISSAYTVKSQLNHQTFLTFNQTPTVCGLILELANKVEAAFKSLFELILANGLGDVGVILLADDDAIYFRLLLHLSTRLL